MTTRARERRDARAREWARRAEKARREDEEADPTGELEDARWAIEWSDQYV